MVTSSEQSWPNVAWTVIGGWPGGTVTTVALSPNFTADQLALAGTQAGLFLSTDGGHHWQRSDEGLADPQISNLLLVATDATVTAFIATQSGHLYQGTISSERRASWQPVDGWAGFGVIQALAASPTYAEDRTLFAATSEGIFRSQDGGNSWESSTFGLLDLDILCLACAPTYSDRQLLWAGSAGGGLYRSRNEARSWRDSGIGLPDSALQALLVSPAYATDETLFVATESDGIYRSTDGSATWAPLSPDLAGLSINCMARSSDGQQWIAGSSDGIYYSTDGGSHWQQATSSHADGPSLMALTVALADNGQAIAGTFLDGLALSSDGGATWALANEGLTAHAPPLSHLTAPAHLSLLDGDGLLMTMTQPAGDSISWLPLNQQLNDEAIITLDTTATAAPLFVMTASDLYWRSAEEIAWQSIPLPQESEEPCLLSASPSFTTDQTLFLGSDQGTVQRSTDGGQRWQQLVVPWQSATLLHLRTSPFYERDQLLYAVTATLPAEPTAAPIPLTIWQGQAGGEQWTALADLQSESAAVALTLPLDLAEQSLLLATQNRLIKLYQAPSDPTASSPQYEWAVAQTFLPPTVRITSIVTTATHLEDRLIYLTTNQGVYVRQDQGGAIDEDGQEWQPAWPEIAEETIVGLHCTENGQPLYAVALGGTIWQSAPGNGHTVGA